MYPLNALLNPKFSTMTALQQRESADAARYRQLSLKVLSDLTIILEVCDIGWLSFDSYHSLPSPFSCKQFVSVDFSGEAYIAIQPRIIKGT